MKIYKYIIWISFLFLGIFYILPIIMLHNSSFQKELSNMVSKYLEEQLGTKVNIEKIEFHFFDKLVLNNIHIEDRSSDTLFSAKKINTNFDFFPLFKSQICINYAQIYAFTLNLTRESENTPLNIKYIMDIFKRRKNQLTKNSISICNFFLKNGNFSYQIKNKKNILNRFNFNNIYLSNITANVQLHKLSNTILKLNLKRMSFVERSGFQVKKLDFDLEMNKNTMKINRFDLNLPASHFLLTKILANYNHVENIFTKKMHFDFQIGYSQLSLKDICFFIPTFLHSQVQLKIMGKFAGSLEDFKITKLSLRENNNLDVNTDIKIHHLDNLHKVRIYAKIKNAYIVPAVLQTVVNKLSLKLFNLPFLAKKVSKFIFNGEILGTLNNLITNVNINTDFGYLQANIRFRKQTVGFLWGKILVPKINVKKYININNNYYGSGAKLAINFNSTFDNYWKNWKGNIAISIKNLDYSSSYDRYSYENIYLLGKFDPSSFNGLLKINSPDGQIYINGLVLLKNKNFEFNFLLKGSNIAFNKFYPTTKYKGLKLSFKANAHFIGNSLNNYAGNILLHKVNFFNDKNIYSIDTICIDILNKKNKKQLLLHSDIINGKIEGLYSIKSLMKIFQHFFVSYFPSLASITQFSLEEKKSNFQLNLTLNNIQELFKFFKLSVIVPQQLHIDGRYNGLYNQLYLNINCSCLDVGDFLVKNVILSLDNKNNYINCNFNGIASSHEENSELIISANFKAINDSIFSIVKWQSNDDSTQYLSKLNFNVKLKLKKSNLEVSAQINPSQIVFNNYVWTIDSTNVFYSLNTNKIDIYHFKARSDKQIVTINGNISKNKNDGLYISLEEVNIGNIFKPLSMGLFDFKGIASGYFIIKDIFHIHQISANLNVRQFIFNDMNIGNITLYGQWDENRQRIVIKGKVANSRNSYINISGVVCPIKEKMFIFFDIHNIEAAFLHKYLGDVVSDFSGQLTGNLHLFGDFNIPTIKGNIWINNGMLKLNYFNTYYTFNNWIKFNPSEVSIQNAIFYDKYRNKAVINALFKYNEFGKFQLTSNLLCKNLLILNTIFNKNLLFYGNIFATGIVTLNGDEKALAIEALLHNNENTIFTINFTKCFDVVDYNFVNFLQKKSDKEIFFNKKKNRANILNPEFHFDLIVNINKKANLEIITNPILDNKIISTGNGNLQIQYDKKNSLKIYGKYTVEKGLCKFSLQNTFLKKFEIVKGSSILFSGDPFMANLDIKASKSVLANISNLEVNTHNQIINNNLPVDCILLFSGQLKSPNMKFDIECPGITTELEKHIKDCIDIREMNWQVLYLLTTGHFDPFLTRAKNKIKFNHNFLTLTSSTLFYQLFNIFENIGNDKFQIEAKYHICEAQIKNRAEIELFLSGTFFNKHLTINTDFSYSKNLVNSNLMNNIFFIGNCDVEYKLTKNGNICFKGFNHYNYPNNKCTASKATQGIAIIFQKDFK